MRLLRLFFLIIICLYSKDLLSQENRTNTIDSDLSQEEVSALTHQLDLRRTEKKWVYRTNQQNQPTKDSSSSFMSNVIFNKITFYLLVIVVVVLMVALIFQLFSVIDDDRSMTKDISEEAVEDVIDIHDINLDDMLSKALEQHNYSLAIRAKFLKILKQLTTQQHIYWSIEKTNRDYIRELHSTRFIDLFRSASSIYERVWYGPVEIDRNTYDQASLIFLSLNDRIKEEDVI